MKKFILWLARVFKVNLNEIDGDLIVRGKIKTTDNVMIYCREEDLEEI